MRLPNPSLLLRAFVSWPVVHGLGLIGGLAWFFLGYSIPETTSAWYSGDPHYYVAQSLTKPKDLFFHSHWRTFGYPFYLSSFRQFFPGESTWRLPAFLLQFLCYLGSCWFLIFALRRHGTKVPSVVVALMFAHPALAGISGLPMSEPLATASVSSALATTILLLNNGRLLVLRALLIGGFLGVALCIRPQMLAFLGVFIGFVGAVVGLLKYYATKRFIPAGFAFILFFVVSAGTFYPCVRHLLNNCMRSYNTFCLIEPGLAQSAMRESILFKATRIWYTPLPIPESAVLCKNVPWPIVFGDCELSRTDFLGELLMCYKRHYKEIPLIFAERLVGSFDNRHIHPYAGKETSTRESFVIRCFSIVTLIGAAAALVIWLCSLGHGEALRKSYLLLPLVYIGAQINFHPEPRYYYPIFPLLFICGMSSLITNQFARRWQRVVFLVSSVAITFYYTTKVVEWDSEIIEPVCKTDYNRLYKPTGQ